MTSKSLQLFYRVMMVILTTVLTVTPFDVSFAQSAACNNIMRNAVVIDFSSSYNDDFAPENLIDGRQNRSWSSAENDEEPFIIFDLGGFFEIDRMQLNGYFQANDPAYQGDSVRDFRLEALVEGQWIAVIEDESPLQNRMIDYRFDSPAVTDQIKISFLTNYGGTAFEAAELVICGQRATSASGNQSGGKQAGGKENPTNEPLLLVQGDLVRDGEDVWTFEASQNQIVSVELQATTRNTYMALYNPSNSRMSEGWTGDNYINSTYATGFFGVQILEDGQYTIRVSGGIGPYTLQVNEGYFGQTVGVGIVGQSVQGTLVENGRDRWLITLSAGQIISIELQSTTRNSYVAIYDPRARRVSEAWAGDSYIDSTYRTGMFGMQILEDGLYMIRVSNGIGPYTLQINEGYFGQTVGTATVGQSVQGTLEENGFNRWLIALSAGQTINIELDAALRNTYVALYDPLGRRVAEAWASGSQGGRQRANINNYQVLTTGLYMIRVFNGIGDYSVRVTG